MFIANNLQILYDPLGVEYHSFNIFLQTLHPFGIIQSNPTESNVYAQLRQACYRTQRVHIFKVLNISYDLLGVRI